MDPFHRFLIKIEEYINIHRIGMNEMGRSKNVFLLECLSKCLNKF